MDYDRILKEQGSFRKAAKFCDTTKAKFVRLWKIQLGLCQRKTGCKNKPEKDKTACRECLDYVGKTIDKENRKKYMKKWREGNREHIKKKAKEYYYKNHEHRRKYANDYYKNNYKLYNKEKRARYRASKKQACPFWVSKTELKKIYKKAPAGYHVDHIIPLTHDQVCGLHVPWNLQYLPDKINDSKANSFDGTSNNESWMKNHCHQYKVKLKTLNEDLKENKPFHLKARDFKFTAESMSKEIRNFISKYEWLGDVGWAVKWAFTARYNGDLAGVILMSEPPNYSKIGGKKEVLIQRGATSSWAPRNLGSKLLMFACKWIVKNTDKRVFVGYSDSDAKEVGFIYQACNFDYLGKSFGSKRQYILPNGKRVGDRYFTRTSSMKKWAQELGIQWELAWEKSNGFQDVTAYPDKVKDQLYKYAREKKAECKMKKIKQKGKYVLILGTNKRETKALRKQLRNYSIEKYPKNC